MTIPEYIAGQPAERQPLLKQLHDIIVTNDPSVSATVGTMMKSEMILYNAPGSFKYGLASVKNYISLHLLPIYGSSALHEKYEALLPDAKFQKGCVNFTDESAIPLKIVKSLIKDCAPIDLAKIRADYLAAKKKK